MDWSQFWSAFAASLPALLAAIAAFIQSLRNGVKADDAKKIAVETKAENTAAVAEVHNIVNSQRQAMMGRISELEETLARKTKEG